LQERAPRIEPLTTDGRFHDIYGWNRDPSFIQWGHIFSSTNLVGVISRNKDGSIQIGGFHGDSIRNRKSLPIWHVNINMSTIESWRNSRADLKLIRAFNHSTQEIIAIRNSVSLSFYRFNENNVLELCSNEFPNLAKVPGDHLYFANLTHSSLTDVIVLKNDNLCVYFYEDSTQSYAQSECLIGFSHGWKGIKCHL